MSFELIIFLAIFSVPIISIIGITGYYGIKLIVEIIQNLRGRY